MKADLHVHSTASDGTLTPSALIFLALERRLDVVAISDHDSVSGLAEAFSAARDSDLTLVPAVELSASLDGRDAHILGYFVSFEDPDFLAALESMRRARVRRSAVMVDILREAGFEITTEGVLEVAGGGSIGRSHIARALVAAGYASSTKEAFERLIGHGRPFYVAKEPLAPQDAIRIIREAGGISVLAHPGVSRVDSHIPHLIEMGLGGLEAYHADHSTEDRERYASMAAELGLLTTGGSDFHGHQAPNPPLGSVDIPEGVIETFLDWGASHTL